MSAGAAAGKGMALLVLAVAGVMLVWWALHGGLWASVFGYSGLTAVIAVALLVAVTVLVGVVVTVEVSVATPAVTVDCGLVDVVVD